MHHLRVCPRSIFLFMTLNLQVTKAKINKWDYLLTSTVEETFNKMTRQPMGCEEILANHKSDKELISKNMRDSYRSIVENN